jgi:VCBS repeat-containing protein
VTQDSDERVIVHGLSVSDVDAAANETFAVTATTAHSGSYAIPSSGSGSLANINLALQTITYNEGSAEPSTDSIKLTVTDGHGATDTVNLIFNLAERASDHVSLTGTTGKDVFFGTGYQEQFVFAANSNHDTIVNFTPGQDHIDLSAVVTTNNISTWMAQHVTASPTNSADTLITIDAADTIVLKGVSVGNLHANDFVVHP